jgi:hypothetical protein
MSRTKIPVLQSRTTKTTALRRENGELRRMWLGTVYTDANTENYNNWRDKLSEAAKYADWAEFWDAMDVGMQTFNESWVCAIRISKSAYSLVEHIYINIHTY